MSLLRPDDYFVTSYRDHGYALARGTDPRPLMAELCGKVTGISRGKGGSMHFYDVPTGNFGGDGIVGGHLPDRRGHGLRDPPARAPTRSCLCFFGDGAVNEGAFHEALNVSALWGLPVVYIIENNRYGMGTSLDRASSVKDLYQRGSAYGIPRRDVNGMDLLTVRDALGEAIDRARKEKRPTLHRGRDLPLPRPLDVRPRQVPHEGGGRGDDAPRPDPASSARSSWSSTGRRRPSSRPSTRTSRPRSPRPCRFAEQSPWPAPETLYEDVYVRSPYIHAQGRRQGPGLARLRSARTACPRRFPAVDQPAAPAKVEG